MANGRIFLIEGRSKVVHPTSWRTFDEIAAWARKNGDDIRGPVRKRKGGGLVVCGVPGEYCVGSARRRVARVDVQYFRKAAR